MRRFRRANQRRGTSTHGGNAGADRRNTIVDGRGEASPHGKRSHKQNWRGHRALPLWATRIGDRNQNWEEGNLSAEDQPEEHLKEQLEEHLEEHLDPMQIDEFHTAFTLFDVDGDGHITIDELATVMRSLGQDPTLQELHQMLDEASFTDQESITNMQINFTQFCSLMVKKLKQTDQVEEQRKAFRVFDQNGDGYISSGELHAVMWQLGTVVTDEEVAEMIREADRDGNGLIDFYEFSLMLAGGHLHSW